MADDLGDSHANSLRQGGALPANSVAVRNVGRIFPAAGTTVRLEGFSSLAGPNWQVAVLSPGMTEITNVSGPQNLDLSFTATTADFYTIRVRNMNADNPSQKVWVKATYTAPRSRHTPPDATPQISNVTASPTTFSFNLQGRAGLSYQIEKSVDLQNWLPLETVVAPALFDDAINSDRAFYRISPVAE